MLFDNRVHYEGHGTRNMLIARRLFTIRNEYLFSQATEKSSNCYSLHLTRSNRHVMLKRLKIVERNNRNFRLLCLREVRPQLVFAEHAVSMETLGFDSIWAEITIHAY